MSRIRSLKAQASAHSIAPVPGDGVAVIFGSRIAYLQITDVTDELVDVISDPNVNWDALVRSLAKRIASADYEHPSVALLELQRSQTKVFMFGDITTTVPRGDEDELLSTGGMSTWLETHIDGSPDGVSIGPVEGEAALGEILLGYVRCGGFTIRADPDALPGTSTAEPPAQQRASGITTPPAFQPPPPTEGKPQDHFEDDATTSLTGSELEQAIGNAENSAE